MKKLGKIVAMLVYKVLLFTFIPIRIMIFPISYIDGYFYERNLVIRHNNGTIKRGSFRDSIYRYHKSEIMKSIKNDTACKYRLMFKDWKLDEFYKDWYLLIG